MEFDFSFRKWKLKGWQIWGMICLLSFILTTIFLHTGLLHTRTAKASPSSSIGDWLTYMGDPGRSGYNPNETTITAATAANLKLHWKAKASKVATQPAVMNGVLYWGSWDGYEHATSTNGKLLWSTYLGATTGKCYPKQAGITSTPTITTLTINGTPTTVLLLAGGNKTFYEVNATNGSIIWSTQLSTSPDDNIWDSPAVYKNSVYIGKSSWGDCPETAGQFFQMDITSGVIKNTFNVVPPGCLGGGLWGSPTLDTATGSIYIATGNSGTCRSPEPYTFAIVELNATNLSVIDTWQVPASQLINDTDFGNTPTLFQATINGVRENMIGVANKNGIFYALQREHLSNGPVWQTTVGVLGFCPPCGQGDISASAFDGTHLYVASDNTTINGTSCQGSLRALAPASGNFIWQACLTAGPVLAGVTVVPGAAVVPQGNTVSLIDTASGQILINLVDTSSFSRFYSAATISNGMLFVGNLNGKFFAYGF